MLHKPLFIPPSSHFWPQAARALLEYGGKWVMDHGNGMQRDWSGLRVVVPDFSCAQKLREALAAELRQTFIPPRITTLSAWLALLPPGSGQPTPPSNRERLVTLYAQLREHGWLKQLFSARRNTDLLPLAQTLLTLFDELSHALVPSMQLSPQAAEERWQAALGQLDERARGVLSHEAQLVWTLWKSQLDQDDPVTACFLQMLRLAQRAEQPLIWISALQPDEMEAAFLAAYGKRQAVLPVIRDWRAEAVPGLLAQAWPEAFDVADGCGQQPVLPDLPTRLSLYRASSLEDEAVRGAQTVVDWLGQGKTRIAIIAQDRVTARRMRALLERAQVHVADETGWKLSTTRAAASLVALMQTVATRGETVSLLDLLKSPFAFTELPDKAQRVMTLETMLRRANVLGGWEQAAAALAEQEPAHDILRRVAEVAALFAGAKTVGNWVAVTKDALQSLGMGRSLILDAAGEQVAALLESLAQDCAQAQTALSFAEWRAYLSLQLEATPFIPLEVDQRVVMLQLNGARLRAFDAVLMVGADAAHLPSALQETLFFGNAVRRELGLPTREARHRTQLRDFAELLIVNPEVVLSWQAYRNGEPNPLSPWVERLQLALERAQAEQIAGHHAEIPLQRLVRRPLTMPAPRAPELLPQRLSASGYNSLVACPYQFFATRMLGLHGMDELTDGPEKRDYGDWLHRILTTYHETVRDRATPQADRLDLLRKISQEVFDAQLRHSAAALGYYARWQKILPAYLDWANERESQGWHFFVGEQWFEKILHWEGGKIILHGRVDRIDQNEEGERAVLDYKTRNQQSLRDRLKEGEDHQLAFYGLLSDLPVSAAQYVALELTKDKVGAADAPNFAQWQQALEAQLIGTVRAISGGATLSATGINQVCQYCEVRGLCRKGGWS